MKKNITISVILFLIFFVNNKFFANTPEQIFCPDNITISCCQDYNNLEITGDPADNNPQFNYFTKVDSLFIDACRIGYVKRIWTGHNLLGQYSCTQIITMERNDEFTGNIQWPPDWAGQCGDEIPFTEPQYDIGFCDQIAHTFKDDTFRFTPNACVKILRNWRVIDWCIYQPNSGSQNGIWEHTQTLMITDQKAPQIAECKDRTIKAMNFNCSANFTLHKEAEDQNCGLNSPLKWVFELDINNDWQIDTTGTIDAQQADLELINIPTGTHKIKWKVFDGCANVSTCMETIKVVDGKAPTPICYLSTTQNLVSGDDSLVFPAKNFIKDAYDNCTSKEDLIFSYSSDPKDSVKTFTCWDLGFQFFRIFAIDEAGNSDFAYVLTRVMSNEPCSNYPLIQGTVTDLSGHPLQNMNIGLIGNGRTYIVDKTNSTGKFSFIYRESDIPVSLTLVNGNNSTPKINVEDLKKLVNYLLGKEDFNEYEKFAADLNNDGRISMNDIIMLKNILTGKQDYSKISNEAKFFIEDLEGNLIETDKFDLPKAPVNIKVLLKGDIKH